jgi:hypothetical protein
VFWIQGLSGRVLKLQGCLAGAHTIRMQTSLPRADVDGNCSTHVYQGGQIERPSQEEWWLTEIKPNSANPSHYENFAI